ncbi:tungstate/molybdate ABC transporter, periplasmic tungstate/molybdate-binding protein [Syntrophotalea carbinolica DSM 2380]|uniref:Tungstate/molybdate ABC transporter, periplasmic tungstate/molybdate-binding protein n=1 Tax=Syntrophotalea carbinolica (strain DSM 2380 / NBRC 103641 / GraBd1) TaxID=338963 RepID=Q3A2T0_SYNC1|nr:tungstate ABC transporter substrate-binding protein WtpA [Syntrophotalea carbinolica]ABA89327.1 tungstate/molybdate ABC transporter, periplasmic tungstate/molybdate-binding protein [Syntrophotalea carbinolica DSM 2380]
MMRNWVRRGCFMVCLLLVLSVPMMALAAPSGKLIIFHAGSLSVPFAAMEKAFEAKYPGVDVLREAGGSTKMARLISEAGKPADIMASADYTVIDKTLIPGNAVVNVRFATNQLVLCYTDKSKFADEINAKNWPEILQRQGVIWGHSEPNLDPCGYRSLMVLQLAEKFYNQPGLSDKLLANRPQANVRPKAVELITLLQNGDMDYAWEYRSVAVQHGLKFITLDDHINLGNYQLDDFYKQAKVQVTGKKPGTFLTRTGQSVTYGVTLINDAPNKEAAEAFLAYLLDPNGGLKILEEMGQPPFVPARVPTAAMQAKLPASVQPLVEVKE